MKRIDLVLDLLVVAMLIAAVICFQHSRTHDPKPKHSHTRTTVCHWDDLCNGVASPARIQAHKHDKETP